MRELMVIIYLSAAGQSSMVSVGFESGDNCRAALSGITNDPWVALPKPGAAGATEDQGIPGKVFAKCVTVK